MSDNNDDSAEHGEKPYAVGYGSPPKQHQFKKGDGRARPGRPRGGRNAKAIIREQHQRPVAVTENGRTRRKPLIEALLQRDASDALKGNEKAKARQINLALQNANEDEAKAAIKSQQQTLAEDKAILDRYLEERLKIHD